MLPFACCTHGAFPAAGGTSGALVENTFGAGLANATMQASVLQVALGMDAASSRPATGAGTSGATAAAVAGPGDAGSRKVISWLGRTAESLADVDHAASPVAPNSPTFRAAAARTPSPAPASSNEAAGTVDYVAVAARSCGVRVGGVTVVLVSGLHERDAAAQEVKTNNSDVARARSAKSPPPQLLFPSTTACGGSVASMLAVPPGRATYDAMPTGLEETVGHDGDIFRPGAELHGDGGGVDDEEAHDPKTAASVCTVEAFRTLQNQLLQQQQRRDNATSTGASAADASSLVPQATTVWYRQVFVGSAEATAEVLCGVSRWWLQRPVQTRHLPTTPSLQTRPASSVRSCNVALTLPAPSLHVKYVGDVFADLWGPHRLISVVQHRYTEQQQQQQQWAGTAGWTVLRWVMLLWTVLVVLAEAMLRGASQLEASAAHGTAHLTAAFFELGKTYGAAQMTALDVGHTGVRGAQLLACAVGSVVAAAAADEKATPAEGSRRELVALDVAGCTELRHRRGELHELAPLLDELHRSAVRRLARANLAGSSAHLLGIADLLLSYSLRDTASLPSRSACGLALALFTHHGRVRWVCGAGCDLDNGALHELGQYALVVEALAVTNGQPPHAATCTLRALDLTSAMSIENINALAYATRLEQLLISFTYVDDAGLNHLDGHTFAHDLRATLALCDAGRRAATAGAAEAAKRSAEAQLERAVDGLRRLVDSVGDDDVAAAAAADRTSRKEAVEVLYHKFRSHLYHFDLTYCICVSSVVGLERQQRLSLLNLSQTRINKAGLFGGAARQQAPQQHRGGRLVQPTPPLRLFIAEMCEHLSDLSGLAHIGTLECVIVRSGSLGDDGLRALCSPDMERLHLLDLSYCDRLHRVGCLAQLPALETLILDSTDVTPAEVKQLRTCPALHTLSLRFCTEFAVIGKSTASLAVVVGHFPALKRYMYEDLAGDEELRKKTN